MTRNLITLNMSNNNNHNTNDNKSSRNIMKHLDNNLIFNYNTNGNSEYPYNDNDTSISNAIVTLNAALLLKTAIATIIL